MYKFLIIIVLGLGLVSCSNSNNKLPTNVINNPNTANGIDESEKMPQVNFKTTEHEFGEVIQGEIVSYGFKFTNTGNADLLLSDVSTSCGCTVPRYPVDPIKPGETKEIQAIFDSESRIGFQNKRITVLTNAIPSKYTLTIKADVIKPGQ